MPGFRLRRVQKPPLDVSVSVFRPFPYFGRTVIVKFQRIIAPQAGLPLSVTMTPSTHPRPGVVLGVKSLGSVEAAFGRISFSFQTVSLLRADSYRQIPTYHCTAGGLALVGDDDALNPPAAGGRGRHRH